MQYIGMILCSLFLFFIWKAKDRDEQSPENETRKQAVEARLEK